MDQGLRGDRIMIKLSELAPALAARIAEDAAKAQPEPARPAAPDERSMRMREASLRVAVEQALERMPTAYQAAELDADWLVRLVGQANIETARTALSAPRVAFTGAPGSGKSTLAAAMYRAALRAERHQGRVLRSRWVSAHALAKARAEHGLGAGEAPLVEAVVSAPLVVIDELGGEDSRYASAVAEVIYERHAESRATWITLGVGPKEVATRYGGGIARRVFEGATVFKLARKP
jgi:DNA replication protein DnaC